MCDFYEAHGEIMSQTMIWSIVIVLMIVFELATLGNLVSVWFAIGGLASLLVSLVSANFTIQIIVFSVVSVISLVLVRPLTHKILKGSEVATNYDRLIGKQMILDQEITHENWGLIKVNGIEWSATTSDHSSIDAGTLVEVTDIEGVKLIVKKV